MHSFAVLPIFEPEDREWWYSPSRNGYATIIAFRILDDGAEEYEDQAEADNAGNAVLWIVPGSYLLEIRPAGVFHRNWATVHRVQVEGGDNRPLRLEVHR